MDRLVRASTALDAPPIVRVVRATYLTGRASDAFRALAPARQEVLAPYLDPDLTR